MKTLFVIKLMIVLVLQPVGLTFAAPGTMSDLGYISDSDVSVLSYKIENPMTCTDMSHCVVVGNMSCDTENTSIITLHDSHEANRASRLDSVHDSQYFQVVGEIILRPPRTS